ncbi:GntR family transcriptional regulator [Jiella pelagia]|uniref:GntR family transcriptional regulator n=1 Tax=Jiella pelagia TaxID=2986949 RepID=A0ABY7BZF2_9HYPH|nr:GntR family transcriptional regulator [Jiella pelagia]WAP68361.1 GntR family transcriptional regulator [Jiella pelagia]
MKRTTAAADDAGTGAEETGPRYLRIHRTLAERIAGGAYPVGSLMPTETELGEEFSTSRFTVREALRCLTEDGYVERRQGMGTRVLSARPQVRYHQSFESLQELFQVAVDTYMVVLGHQPVILEAELAERIGGRTGERWIRVDGVRWTGPGGRPICYIQSYVPERFEALVPQFADHQGSFFDLLERRSREVIEEAQQEIRAVEMPLPISRQLGLPAGALALQLLRRYVTNSGILIASFNWHAADQMTYKMRIRRSRQPPE